MLDSPHYTRHPRRAPRATSPPRFLQRGEGLGTGKQPYNRAAWMRPISIALA